SFARLIGTLLVPNQTRSAQTRVSLRDRGSGAGRALVTRRRAALRQARLSFSLRQDLAIPFGRDALQAVHDRTGPGRDQAADDDVLLQTDQIVGLAVHGRLREDAGRLLEGGRGDEGAGVQAGLGDALEHRLCRRRAAILGHHLGIDLLELLAIGLLSGQEGGVAGVGDLHLLQHLPDDDLDVLVVDHHALQAINALHLIDEVLRQRLDPQDLQNVVRHRVAVHQQVALLDPVTLLDGDVLALRDPVFDGITLLRPHDDPAAGLVVPAEFDAAVDLADDGIVLRLAGFEELGDTRQTAGDVTRLGRLPRDTRQDVTGAYLGAVVDREDGVHRHVVASLEAIRQRDDLTVVIPQGDARTQIAAPRLLLPVGDHAIGNTGRLVQHLAHGESVDQVDVVGDTFLLGDDRDGIGVPLRQLVAPLDLGLLLDQQTRPIGDPVTGTLAALLVLKDDLQVAAHHDLHALGVHHDVVVLEGHRGVLCGFHTRLLGAALSGPANVEGPHGQLRSRLTDGLGGDD